MNVVITGASRGIGLELVTQALEKGHRVLAVARDPGRSPELQALTKSSALEIVAVDLSTDVAAQIIEKAAGSWPVVDLLINDAGVFRPGETVDDFMQSFRINAVAPFLVTRALLSQLRKSTNPKVIQITSRMGSIADNESGGDYAYRSSKAALNMINQSLTRDESWLTTAVIHPGWVKTRMGGADATTSVKESVTGIWKVIEQLKHQDSGSFFDYEGDRIQW